MRASKEARTHRRWREQVARLILLSGDPSARWTAEGPIRDVVAAGPAHFDVAHVRAYAERLMWEAHRLTRPGHADVVRDWCEERTASVLDVPASLAPAGNGAGLARTGRRLLDALDGRCPWAPSAAAQPSECQRCGGDGRLLALGPEWRDRLVTCGDCRGTGHNRSGTLPPVEWSAQTRRKAADGLDDEDDESTVVTAWTSAVGDVVELKREWPRTRVVPRGQHRTLTQAEARAYGVQAWRGDEPSEWAARAVAHALDRDPDKTLAEMRERHALGMKHLPRWRRGELRHSEQRREREHRRQENRPIGTVREARADGSAVVDLDF